MDGNYVAGNYVDDHFADGYSVDVLKTTSTATEDLSSAFVEDRGSRL